MYPVWWVPYCQSHRLLYSATVYLWHSNNILETITVPIGFWSTCCTNTCPLIPHLLRLLLRLWLRDRRRLRSRPRDIIESNLPENLHILKKVLSINYFHPYNELMFDKFPLWNLGKLLFRSVTRCCYGLIMSRTTNW